MDKEEKSKKSSRKRERSRSRSYSPSSRHKRDGKGKDSSRHRDRSVEKKSSKHDRNGRSPDRRRDSRDRSEDRKRGRSYEKNSDRSKEKKRDRSVEKDRDRSLERVRDRSADRGRDRSADRGRDRSADRGRERSLDRGRDRSSDRDRRPRNRYDDRNSDRKDINAHSEQASKDSRANSNILASFTTEHWAEEREAQKQKEEAEIEEEVRKRKERVKAWQEAKRLSMLQNEDNPSLPSKPESNESTLEKDGTNEINDVNDSAVSQEQTVRQWSLEDDDDEELAGEIKVADIGPEDDSALNVPDIPISDAEDIDPIAFDGSTVKTVAKKRKLRFSSDSHAVKHASESSPAIQAPAILPTASIQSPSKQSKSRFEKTQPTATAPQLPVPEEAEVDPLDAFMTNLYGSGLVEKQKDLPKTMKSYPAPKQSVTTEGLSEDEDEYSFYTGTGKVNPFGSNFITLDQLLGQNAQGDKRVPASWESDIGGSSPAPNLEDMDDEAREAREERERLEFFETIRKAQLEKDAAELEEQKMLLAMQENATNASEIGAQPTQELGRIFADDGDIEDEENLELVKRKNALEAIEEAKKGKELKPVDHSSIDYLPFKKNIYIVPRALSKLSKDEIKDRRDALAIVVRGKECPAPVETWEQCGLSDRILEILSIHNLQSPFAIQMQAIPAIMCGRDIIGVAKTGSGKTLAFLLPIIRHIQDQPPLKDGDGPIALIMAPSRELALQIRNEAKKFAKYLNLRVACVYGGAAVADQIAELKRGAEIVVCTPGRMIELLCMQAGKMLSLRRVTIVVLDEADRMFDMGFESQIKMIMQNIRPDRQTVLFSATFPKQIEKLAKSMLKFPLEIVVGERSSVNKDITQYIEVHEEEDKFLRLLQILGIWYEKGSVLIFVDTQEKCDSLYSDLLRSGYPCVNLHGGKDQVDRDYTLHQFKSGDFTVMVATSVAGRGLDVPDIVCVVNYNCPNHLEDYVHRVGRTGRAGRKGTAYTFISSKEEQYAPIMIRVLERGKIEPIPPELAALNKSFQEKVSRGEAHYVSSGFVGKGFKFDATEMNEQQKVASLQKRQYDIENGLVDDDAGAIGDIDSDEDEAPITNEDGLSAQITKQSDISASAAVTVSLPSIPGVSSGMTPVERARALVANRGMIGNALPSDPKAALSKALLLARQMASSSTEGGQTVFSDEFDINDYPAQARRKLSQKQVMEDILERTGARVISKGAYVPPGKKLEIGEKRLYLLIEGDTELVVKQAKLEFQRVLEEETLRLGATGAVAAAGRYSVV